ncbi:MAG: hypothetical protein ACTSV1_01550 [Alphaproteobacteria bacterium]
MRRWFHKFILIAVLLLQPTLALAGGNDKTRPSELIPDAKVLIDACWAISEKLRSSMGTDDQRVGAHKTAICLVEEIIKHADILIDDAALTKAKIRKKMEALHQAYGSLYWSLYNDVEACDLSCGTLFHSFHNWSLAKLYEKILTDVIKQREEYKW